MFIHTKYCFCKYKACGYLATKIYCFGGRLLDQKTGDTSMIMLDIFNSSGTTADEFKDKWVTVTTNTNGLDIKGRNGISTVPLPDGKSMLLLGGGVTGTTKLASQMIAFNGETKTWQGYPDYTEPPYGSRQMLVEFNVTCTSVVSQLILKRL